MKSLITLFIFLCAVYSYSQENVLLENQKKVSLLQSKETQRVKSFLKITSTQILKPINNIQTLGLLDTFSYNDGTFNTDFGIFGHDWILQWYKAPAELVVKSLGFYCTENANDTPVEVKLVKVNWSESQLIGADTVRRGYYEALGNGFNDITSFLDNPDRTGGWTSIQRGDTEPFGEDLWSDGGIGYSFIPDETLNDYQWVDLTSLWDLIISQGEIFGVAVKNTSPNMDEDRIGFLAGIVGFPGWKFYVNGRFDPGADIGWWTTEYTFDFPVAVDIVEGSSPEFLGYSILNSTLSEEPLPVYALVKSSDQPAKLNAGIIVSVDLYYSTDDGSTWQYYPPILLNHEIDSLYTGELPGFPAGTNVAYYFEAVDTNTTHTTITSTIEYTVFGPSGANTLVLFNGFYSPYGYPQDYYFGPELFPGGELNFAHDIWGYGKAPAELFDYYSNIIEICNGAPESYTDSLVKPWLEADGNRNYFLAGQEWLGDRYGYVDQDFTPGDFEYDILGITHSYNDVSYDGVSGQNIPSLVLPVESSLFGEPIRTFFNSLNPPADSLMYNPNFELGTSNWIDGFETTNDVVVDMEVETRGIAGIPDIQMKPTAIHRELTAGNKIVFLAYDPIALNTALSDDYSYYHWVGYDSSNTPYQTLKWFGIDIVTEVNDPSDNSLPKEFSLNQNYPNPYNPSTKISWQSPAGSWQTLKVYDVLGNEVATLVNEYRNAGSYQVNFDASSLASGVYFYQLKAGSFIQTRKMIVLK